jgi:molecular chaperone HscB
VPDYFQALQYPEPRLRLDLADLQKRFYARSRELHPDRFARAPLAEQQAALDASSVLNDAYRALRDPVQRAEYALKLAGFEIGEQRAPADLLEEVFELNMALEELQSGDESVRHQVDSARTKFETMRHELDQQLETLFGEYDAAPSRATLEKIQAQLNRRRYITNLIATASGEKVRH